MKITVAIFLFILSLLLIGQNLDKPFWGEHDWNGVRYGNIARNFLRYGILDLKFAQIENSGSAKKEEFQYFTHYPPLPPLFISFSYKLFGISEWSTRIVPLLFTSGSIVLIFLIGTHLWNIKIGILSSLLIIFTPLILYFGKNPVHEPLVMFFVLFAFYCYLTKSKLIWLGLILAQLTTWAGFFLIPAVTLVEFIRKNYGKVKKTLPFWALSIVIFLFHIGHTKYLTGDFFGGDLFGALLLRSGISDGGISDFNLFSYIGSLRLWASTLYTNTLLGLVFLWLISRVKGFKDQDYSIITLGIFGTAYFIFFPNASFIHNYLTFYFLPFFALAGVRGLEFLISLKFFQNLKYALMLIILLGLILERRDFLEALERSDMDKLGVEVGKAIAEQANFNDTVLISPVRFSYSADKFLRFYGDRRIIYSDDGEDYDVKVKVDQENGKFEIIEKDLR